MVADIPLHSAFPDRVTMAEEPIPSGWNQAIPSLIWGALVLAFAFLFVDSLGQLFADPIRRGGFAFTAMLGLVAVTIYRKWLWTKFQSLSGGSVLAAILVFIVVIALSPFVEQRRWPFQSSSIPGLFNAQYMTRMSRIASIPPKAMR